MIPFLDLDLQYNQIKDEIKDSINLVLESKKFIMGEFEQTFSREFCRVHGSSYGVGCSNGTSAITVALRSLGITQGDEVITVANSFFATAEAIVEVGATPVFVDCNEDDYSINVEEVQKKISAKTKAIIPVHLYGNPANMTMLENLAKDNSLFIIEDCAQAHLAKIDGRAVGTFGEFGTFSFYPGKNLGAYGDAGEIISEKRELVDIARMHIDHGRTDKYEHEFCAGNFRMDGIQAAILSVKLKYIDEWTNQRIAAAKIYNDALLERKFKVLNVSDNKKCVYHLYPVEVSNRDEVIRHLKSKNIGCGIHYPIPLHLQPALKFLKYSEGDFPIAENSAKRMVSIPIFPGISTDQQKVVLNEFLNVAKA